MNFPIIINAPCNPTGQPVLDPRCSDPAFALAHPDICLLSPVLVIKPGTLLVCQLKSVQFQAFVNRNGTETLVTDGVEWSVSDPTVALIGATSGNATGVSAGAVTITAKYQSLTANASLDVLGGSNCCDANSVATMIVLDVSKSMSQVFGSGYPTKGAFAAALASQYAAQTNTQKDQIGLIVFDDTPTTVDDLTSDASKVASDAAAEIPTILKTSIGIALQSAADLLALSAADVKAILLISDGEDKDTAPANDTIAISEAFKRTGGIILCAGIRAHDYGYNTLNAIATGGFFVNAYPSIATDALNTVFGLKGYICAGNCVPAGNILEHQPALDYADFISWDVTAGHVDLFGPGLFDLLPGNGLYVSLASNIAPFTGQISSKATFSFAVGKVYRLSLRLAGNQRKDFPNYAVKVQIGDGSAFAQTIALPDFTQDFHDYNYSFQVQSAVAGKLIITQITDGSATEAYGDLLSQVSLTNTTDLVTMLFDDFSNENLVYIPPACGVITGTGIANPPAPTLSLVPTPGANLSPFVAYVVSWTTAQGHTAMSAAAFTDCPSDNAVTVTLPAPPPEVVSVQIWRESPADYPPDLNHFYLLNNLPAVVPNYTDQLDAANWDATHPPQSAPSTNTTAGIAYAGYNCYGYGCLESPPGIQQADPNPLPDIEAGYVPPTTYTSTQSYTAYCPAGTVQINQTSAIPVMTSPTAPSGVVTTSGELEGFEAWRAFGAGPAWKDNDTAGWIQYQFAVPTLIIASKFDTASVGLPTTPYAWQLQGSFDGLAWDTLVPYSNETTDGQALYVPLPQAKAYSYYRLNFVLQPGFGTFGIATWELYTQTTTAPGVTREATATSLVSQQKADQDALAAATKAAQDALDIIGCVAVFTATESATASCPVGQLGSPVTKTATVTSFVSLAQAESDASAAALAAAQAALVCTGSNNQQAIVINDYGSDPPAQPYPSIKYVSGLTGLITKVTVTLKSLTHPSPSDLAFLLVSPSGTKCLFMWDCGNGHPVSAVNLTFDDAASTNLSAAQIVSGTFKPTQLAGDPTFTAPAPTPPFNHTLAAFIGEVGNGSWALWCSDFKALDNGSVDLGWDLAITSA